MTSRNLTEVFVLMRNNARASRNMYADDRAGGDSERLLKRRSLHDAEEGLELRDDCGTPPAWTDKLEETQYALAKIKPKLEELDALHSRHLLRPRMDDSCEEEQQIEGLSQEISKLICSTHRHIQCIRSSLGYGNKLEQRLTKSVVTYLLNALQEVSTRFRSSQSTYLKQLQSREARSNVFFEATDFTTIDLNPAEPSGAQFTSSSAHYDVVEDDFLLRGPTKSNLIHNNNGFVDETDEQIDEYFQKPVSNRMTQQQLLLFEEENTKMAEHREQEVTKVVQSIMDLHDIFKDLASMVQEQGTVLDRIDYNVEQTQVTVGQGLKQLRQAEVYHRKNRKMFCILVLAGVTLFMMVLLIFIKL